MGVGHTHHHSSGTYLCCGVIFEDAKLFAKILCTIIILGITYTKMKELALWRYGVYTFVSATFHYNITISC